LSGIQKRADLLSDGGLLDLKPDCGNCFGLCCVAPAFSASADFALDKEAGNPCPNLRADFGCGIYHRLKQRGFRGCTVYDCFGAGQKVAQEIYGGQDWRQAPDTAKQMFDVYLTMRQLHEMLWYLTQALTLPPARNLREELKAVFRETEHVTHGSPEVLMQLDVAGHRDRVNSLLMRVSELVRAGVRCRKKDRNGADLIGANLKGADLRGANLRGAYLIGANLEGADLRLADLIGADLRDADLTAADLTESIFLTQSQINAAQGDVYTKLPPSLIHPPHWSGSRRSAAGLGSR
jgi:Pentapeptide repeats (8 copies)